MTLFDCLSMNERVLLLIDEPYFYTWNRSLTLQNWIMIDGDVTEVDICTLNSEPKNFEAAVKLAQKWQVEEL